MTSRRQPKSTTTTVRGQAASVNGPASTRQDGTASDSEEDSASSLPALSEISTLNGSEDSAETRDAPVPPHFSPLFEQYTEETPEGFDSRTRPCLFWFQGCTNKFSLPQDWAACAQGHIIAKRIDPPAKAICKACPDVKFLGTNKWHSWQLALEHMWENHVEHGQFKTLFGDQETDVAFVKWLLAKSFISTADYQTLLKDPFSTEINPVTRTARFTERRGVAGGGRARR